MSIAQYLSKLGLGVNAQGVLSAAKGGTGGSSGGGGGSNNSPTITAITYPGNDTAVDTAGGSTVTLTGTNFNTGVNVVINGVSAPVVTRISATELTFTTPAQPTGSYIVYVINTDGTTALLVPGIQYSPAPSWTTAAGNLGTAVVSGSFSTTLASTGDAPITYSIISGTLPSGITLNSSTGVLGGTAGSVANTTTYNFTVRSTDAQAQDTDRAFSITVNPYAPPPSVDYLVVAGGGGAVGEYTGNAVPGGGGGGGGVVYQTNYSGLTIGTTYAITVGAGGTKSIFNTSTVGGNGGNSSIASLIVAIGGGGGGSYQAGAAGGSGGGGGNGGAGGSTTQALSGTKPAGATAYGTNGGTGGTSNQGGPGGGGATIAGSNPTGINGANGGSGFTTSITGTAIEYAGGGGGGGYYQNPATGGSGLGGGANGGSTTTNATLATPNRGGGGGSAPNNRVASAGGSGVVIIRYPDTYSVPAAVTGSPTLTVTGGYKIYTFTSSGSITL
jgi:hypothetical protein